MPPSQQHLAVRNSNKRQPDSGWGAFVFTIFVGVPLALASVPIAALSFAARRILRKGTPKPLPPPADDKLIKERKKGERREFDLVLYGATGFTGRLAAQYLAQRYGHEFRWAIAGRRQRALEDVRTELQSIRADLRDLPIVIANADDNDALFKLAARTTVVISTAGPFQRFGSLLLRACAHNGTGYCDITGEVDWVRQMVCLYDEVARKSGARIVNMCGHDSVPWDLLALQMGNELRAKGEEVVSMQFFDEVRAQPSGGTLESIRNILAEGKPPCPKTACDPLLLTAEKTKSGYNTVLANPALISFSREHGKWIAPSIMASVNGNCVKRSNALLQYGKNVQYIEANAHPSFKDALVKFVSMTLFGLFLLIPPTRWALYKFVLPAPGEGPSERAMAAGFLHVFGTATGSKGSKVRSMMYIDDDPAYRDTARMLVEAGLAIALNGDSISVHGGVLTPASCQGHVLIKRLQSKGTIFAN